MYRDLFEIERGLVLLDQCSIGPLPKAGAKAVCDAIQAHATQGLRGMPGLPVSTEAVEACRVSAARLINCNIDEICFIKNTVEGLNTIANGIRWREGDNIVSSRIEFPANIYAWMKLKDRGVELRLAETEEGRVTLETLKPLIDQRTRAVTVSFVQFLNGYRADLKTIGSFCRARGILFIVDGIQGIGAIDVDVHDCQIDFLASGGHKWLLSPIGTGILYCRRDLIEDMDVSNVGHLSMLKSRPFTAINFQFRSDARRFEGGVVSYPVVCGLGASIDMFLRIGMKNVERQITQLSNYSAQGLSERGYRVISPRGKNEVSGIVAFEIDDEETAESIHRSMNQCNILISRHSNILRVAPHFFNSEQDIDAFLAALPSLN
jgi:cysteine desulfurase/selenocysteine lyase